jgi:hypothetical protein
MKDRKLDIENATIIDLGQKTIFETSIAIPPGFAAVFACRAAETPVIRENENCEKEYRDDVSNILGLLEIADDLTIKKFTEDQLQAIPKSISQIGLLVIGGFQ